MTRALIFLQQKNGLKYGIQCKYYSHPVGNKAIQEAYAGADFYDCDAAMVMTNNTFTRAARELAEKLEVDSGNTARQMAVHLL